MEVMASQTGSYEVFSYQIRAPYSLPQGPRIRLLPEGTLRMWLENFGYQDIEVGSAELDYRFTVKSDDEERARAILLRGADTLGAQADFVGSFESSPEEIILSLDFLGRNIRSFEDYGERAQALLQAVAAMASTDLWSIAELRALPGGATSWPDDVGPPIIAIRAPCEVLFSVAIGPHGAETTARASVRQNRGKWDFFLDDAGESLALLELGVSAQPLLAKSRIVVREGDVVLQWPGLCTEHDVLIAGASFLCSVARSGSSIYR
jgi:hypothetical protein